MSGGEASTRYVCVALDHTTGDGLSHGHFTVCRETWGYCASPQPSDGHDWAEVSGVLHGTPEELAHRIHVLRQAHVRPAPEAGSNEAV